MRRSRLSSVRRTVPILAVSGMLMTLLGASPVAASDPFSLTAYIGGSCIYAQGPVNDHYILSVRDRVGRLQARRHGVTDSTGYAYQCISRYVEQHDHLTIKDASHTHSLVVPVLTVAVNRVTDVVSGITTPGADVRVTGYHNTTYNGSTSFGPVHATAASNGRWSIDLSSSVDVIGDDYLYDSITMGANDQVYRDVTAPYMTLYGDTNSLYGYASPAKLVDVNLRTSGGVLKGKAADVTNPSGYFSSYFLDSNLAAVYPRPGDRVRGSFATDAVLTYPATSLLGTASNDHLTGRCLPNRPYQAYAYQSPGYSYQYGTTDASGGFTADMSSGSYPTFDLHAGDYIQVRCKTSNGDEIELYGDAKA